MAREAFGSIKQRGKRYLGRYYYRGRCYYTPTRPRKTDVRADLTEVQAAILAGTWTPPKPRKRGVKSVAISGRPTVAEYARLWLADLECAGRSPNTLRSYRSSLNAHVTPVIGTVLLDELTTADIAGVISRMDRSRVTKRNVLRSLSSLLVHAHKAGVIAKVPELPSVEGRSEPSRRRALTAVELRAVLDAVPDLDVRAALSLASWCALRYGELAALDVAALDMDAWTVRVERAVKRAPSGAPVLGPPKSRAGYRTVSVPPQAREAVAAYMAVRGDKPGLLFPRVPGWGGYWSDRALRTRLAEACTAAGVEPVGLHELRHTGLTLFGQAGATLADLMYRAGHTSADTVMIYQHSTAERDRELAARMG